jgi:hypothetical protein
MLKLEERVPEGGTPAVRRKPVAMCINGDRLREIRMGMEVSQAEFAQLVRKAGQELGSPNACTKRLVQHWESGTGCQPNYRRALSRVTGLSYVQLCAGAGQAETAASGLRSLPDVSTNRAALAVLGEVSSQLAGIQARLEEVARGLAGR